MKKALSDLGPFTHNDWNIWKLEHPGENASKVVRTITMQQTHPLPDFAGQNVAEAAIKVAGRRCRQSDHIRPLEKLQTLLNFGIFNANGPPLHFPGMELEHILNRQLLVFTELGS
jgi:hypothetical protein